MNHARALHRIALGALTLAPLVGCGKVTDVFDEQADADASVSGDSMRSDTDVPLDGTGLDATVVDGTGVDATGLDSTGPDTSGCKGLECKVVDCGTRPPTTVTGTVYAPNGKMPIYNATVYVPNADVPPMPSGVQCDRCGSAPKGEPLAIAITDAKGRFELKNVPVAADVPLVIQIGKWRRIVKIPVSSACAENPIVDAGLTRLPKNQSEGSMPKIAVTVGACDKLACMLPKIGLDRSEFGVDGSPAAVHFYQPSGGFGTSGGPPGMKDARVLWDDAAKLKQYDVVIFSCECSEVTGPPGSGSKDATSFAAVDEYLKAGGRVFTTDFQYLWYKQSPDAAMRSVVAIPGGAPTGGNPVDLVTTFPKGKALSDWLAYIDPSVTPGKATCDFVFNNFSPADPTKSKTWGSSAGGSGGAGPGINPRFLTINTPVGVPATSQCGKALHMDAHINGSDTIDTGFPSGCTTPIKVGEEAFAFFLFDLMSCIQDDTDEPKPPPRK